MTLPATLYLGDSPHPLERRGLDHVDYTGKSDAMVRDPKGIGKEPCQPGRLLQRTVLYGHGSQSCESSDCLCQGAWQIHKLDRDQNPAISNPLGARGELDAPPYQ